MYSDCGTQLKSASMKLTQFGWNGGTEWNFTKSVNAPSKVSKENITKVIGNATLTIGELQTVMFGIANVLIERPIGMKNGSSAVQSSFLCPYD